MASSPKIGLLPLTWACLRRALSVPSTRPFLFRAVPSTLAPVHLNRFNPFFGMVVPRPTWTRNRSTDLQHVGQAQMVRGKGRRSKSLFQKRFKTSITSLDQLESDHYAGPYKLQYPNPNSHLFQEKYILVTRGYEGLLALLLGAKGIATRSKGITTRSEFLPGVLRSFQKRRCLGRWAPAVRARPSWP